jgi:hypothetical protein
MLFAVCCIAVCGPLPAMAAVIVEGHRPRERVTLTVRDATIGAALRDLSQAYGFEIKGALGGDAAMSTTISGNLSDVLARLLRNVNHVIVRSPDNRSGVEKVIIMERDPAPQPGGGSPVVNGGRSQPEPFTDPSPMDDD